ncbi:MAG: hypothetical protein PHW33_04240 [Candidatus Portnoybacteria bacterium]|jgi:hypothetical protein|nr:hypothetical protein [Candidatus Portnoybacteria bacterium]
MRLTIFSPKNTALNVLRRAGYSFLRQDGQTGEQSFAKRVGSADFPRFHVYAKQNEKGEIEVSLHLDQKKASYKGVAAHSGEYDSAGWLAKEAEFLKQEFAK